MKISVIVCCYNSASRLRETLLHLAQQEVTEGFNWEVVLVDNNSTDGTAEVAQSLWAEFGNPVPLRIVKEPNPGLSYARKKGVEESKGELLVLCDDDNWLEMQYVQKVCDVFTYSPTDVGIIGGVGTPIIQAAEQYPYLNEVIIRQLACGPQGNGTSLQDITLQKGYVYGAGMAARKIVLEKAMANQNLLSDRKGKSLASGGDVELCYKARLEGYKIYYSPELKFNHFIPSDRLKYTYTDKLAFGSAVSHVLLNAYRHILNKSYLIDRSNIWLYYLFNTLKGNPLFILDLTIQKPNSIKRIKAYSTWGHVVGILKLNYRYDNIVKELKKKYIDYLHS